MGSTAVSAELVNILLVPMVVTWVLHLYQRKFHTAGARKRVATMWLTFLLIGVWTVVKLFAAVNVSDDWLLVVAALVVGLLIWQRKVLLPFSPRCTRCGNPVSVISMMCRDSNTCEACEPPATEGETT